MAAIVDISAFAPRLIRLSVCHYPDLRPEAFWQDDDRRIRDAGLSQVRFGDFSWSSIEPGLFEYEWMEREAETLQAAVVRVSLATTTVTPSKCLVDALPVMDSIGQDGRPRTMFKPDARYCWAL